MTANTFREKGELALAEGRDLSLPMMEALLIIEQSMDKHTNHFLEKNKNKEQGEIEQNNTVPNHTSDMMSPEQPWGIK